MRKPLLLALGVLPLLVAACGGGDDDVATPNDEGVVEITMKDIEFDPNEVEVDQGQTVTFEFRNDGELVHEAFIGTAAEQDAHEMEMNPSAENGDDADGGDGTDEMTTMAGDGTDEMTTMAGDGADDEDASAGMDEPLTVDPGKSASVEYTFDEPGTWEIGCHEPGHYAAGMIVRINVR